MLLDIFGAFTSLLSTYYFIRLDKRAWWVTLLATSLNAVLYWQNGIYADMTLEFFYFLSTFYGWYLWREPENQKSSSIRSLSLKQGSFLIISVGILFFILENLLSTLTNSNVALLDALTTSLSLAAQWLMCHKVITTWILWFITDALYAYMYFQKQLPFHGILMILYTGMAIVGYLSWAKQKANKNSEALQEPQDRPFEEPQDRLRDYSA